LLRAVTPKSQDFAVTLSTFAFALKDSVKPDFTVSPAWRAEFYRRLQSAGVPVDRALYDSASTEVDRLIGDRVARLVFGDSTAKRRELKDDVQLERALEILRKGETQRDLFASEHR